MPLILGIDNLVLDPATTFGTVPVGAILPVMSNITGSFTVPATGVEDGGFMLCDGAAIPGGQSMSGSTPNLSDGRFLMGSSVAGTAAGANNQTPTGSISSSFSGAAVARTDFFKNATYTPSGSVSTTVTFNKNVLNTTSHQSAHAHVLTSSTFNNLVVQGVTSGGTNKTVNSTIQPSSTYTASSDGRYASWVSSTAATSESSSFSGSGINIRSTFGNTGSYVPSGSISGSFTGASRDIRPNYLSTVYVIRTK